MAGVIDEVAAAKWDQLLEVAPRSTLYHSTSWGRIWSQAFPWGKPRWFVYRHDGTPRALIPLYEKYNKFISVCGCEYGGILALDENVDFGSVLDVLQNNLHKQIDIKFHPLLEDDFEVPEGYDETTHAHTYLLDVQRDSDELLGSFRNTTRHAIEGAIDSPLTVERGARSLVDDFYGPYISSIKHNSAIPYPKRFYRTMARELPADDLNIYIARHEGRVVSSIQVTHHGRFSHYFKAGNTPEGYELDANPLLVWRAIQDARERGSTYLDFGATPEGTGLDTFKRGWRGEKRPIRSFTTGTGVQRDEDSPLLKKAWGRLPPKVMEILSPLALWVTA